MMMLQTQVIAVVLLLVGGAHTSDIDTKISKGPRAKGNLAPFSVYLGYYGTQVVCGGSLVHDDLVLTLAACVRERNSSLITVTAGHRKLYKTEGETKHTVNEIVEYPGNSNISTDVVLLRLESPVNTSLPSVGTTVLSDMAPTLEDSCFLSAYGDTGRAREFKQSLDIVVLNDIGVCDGFVFGSSRCYQPRYRKWQGKKMACEGDQGSPIVCELNGTVVQVGINLASSCASIRLAARNVDVVTAWVESVINPTTAYVCDDSKKWRLVYKHDANGVPVAGYENGHQTLIDLVRGGAELKVKTNIGFHTVQKATIASNGSAVFAQSLFYPIFFPSNVRLVVNLYQVASSTGDVHLTSLWPGYPEGETQPGGRPVYSNTNSKRALSWFVRESGVPVNDKAALGKLIKRGSSVWYAWQRALLPLEAVSFSKTDGGSIRVKANTDIMNETFTKDISDAEWFADPCSVPVYRHDENGTRLSGSLAALTTAARSGKRITIAIDGVFYKTTMLTVSGNDSSVTAQVYDALATGDDSLATGEPAWKWVEASTSGETRVIIQQVGLPNANTMTSQYRRIAWFAESRDWTLTFQTALDKTVISGSLEDLKNAYNAGADVRYGVTRTDGGETEIMQADSILDHPRLPLWVYFGRKLQVDVNGTDVSVKRYDTITYLNLWKQVQNGIEAEGKYESGVTDDVAITWWTSPTSP